MNGYTPQADDLVWDETARRVGRVMGHMGGCWQLKPPGGGREWNAHGPLRPATAAEKLSAGVAMANARSRGRGAVSAPATDRPPLSAECTLGRQPGYGDVHRMCNQTKDVPLPYSNGAVLLARRCGCSCHRQGGAS